MLDAGCEFLLGLHISQGGAHGLREIGEVFGECGIKAGSLEVWF